MAPVMPFLAEEMWGNLVRGACDGAPDSVHLSGYPEPNPALADDELVAGIDAVRTVIELGRRARSGANLKLRQPLAAVVVASEDPARRAHVEQHATLIAAELAVKQVRVADSAQEFAQVEVMPLLKVLGPKYGRDLGMIRGLLREGDFRLADGRVHVGAWTLEPDEFELRTRAREGFAVALDTDVTPDLRLEGVVRDVIRQVNEMRKEAGLEVTDRIRLTFPEGDGDVTEAFRRHGEWIASETLAVELRPGAELGVERAG